MSEQAAMTGSLLIIDGPIGVGKSTLGASIVAYCEARGRRALLFREQIEPEFLELMLSSKQHLFAFQAAVLVQKVATLKHAVSIAALTGALVIVDRGPVGDYGFAMMHRDAGHISEREWTVYTSLLRQAPASAVCSRVVREACGLADNSASPCPIKTVLLTADPDAALERMRARNNKAEITTYDLAYFARLHAIYSTLFADSGAVHVDCSRQHTVDANGLLDDSVVQQFFATIGLI